MSSGNACVTVTMWGCFCHQEITQLSNLIILDLTKNRLSTLPSGLDHMLCLKDLIMSENFLESVPSTLGKHDGNTMSANYLTKFSAQVICVVCINLSWT